MNNSDVLKPENYDEFMAELDRRYRFQIRNHNHISETMTKEEWIEIYGGYTAQEVVDSLNEESKY